MRTPDTIILAGGKGTRLASLPDDIPKGLRPVAGRPFLAHLVEQVDKLGASRIILCLGHRHDAFASFVDEHDVLTSIEANPLGTGGALRHALPLLGSETVLVMNGDSFADADLSGLLEAHRIHRDDITILLCRVQDTSRYGRVDINWNGSVARFIEKGKNGPGLINAGVYVFKRSAIAEIPEGRRMSLEEEILPSKIGARFHAFIGDFPFIDIGTPESYQDAEAFFAGRK